MGSRQAGTLRGGSRLTIAFDPARSQILGFRLASHHLAARLPAGSLLTAAGACGVQNTPPGTAALALHARVAGPAPDDIDRALAVDKTLLQAWSMRAAPYVFPTADAVVFMAGVLPKDEESLRAFILGAGAGLDRVGISATDLVARTAAELPAVLDRRELDKDELGFEIAGRVAPGLASRRRAAWRSPSPYAAGQSLGESLVRFALAVVALQGAVCFAPRSGNTATFLRTDQWLGAPLPPVEHDQARAELVRRYLHCYGPYTARYFAEWAGIAPAQAAQAWRLIEHKLLEARLDGRPAWFLECDLPGLTSATMPHGVRLLPPHDPYLQVRDRATLVPDRDLHRHLWRASGNPGVVLVDGECVGAWRPRKQGRRLHLVIERFAWVPKRTRRAVEAEAATLAPFKGCDAAVVDWSG